MVWLMAVPPVAMERVPAGAFGAGTIYGDNLVAA